jgi:hypothetical protein
MWPIRHGVEIRVRHRYLEITSASQTLTISTFKTLDLYSRWVKRLKYLHTFTILQDSRSMPKYEKRKFPVSTHLDSFRYNGKEHIAWLARMSKK